MAHNFGVAEGGATPTTCPYLCGFRFLLSSAPMAQIFGVAGGCATPTTCPYLCGFRFFLYIKLCLSTVLFAKDAYTSLRLTFATFTNSKHSFFYFRKLSKITLNL